MASLSHEQRNSALSAVADALEARKSDIFEANRIDLANAEAGSLAAPIISRLKFDEHKLNDVINGIRDLINLPDPVGRTLLQRELDSQLILTKTTCPIGVIGVIF